MLDLRDARKVTLTTTYLYLYLLASDVLNALSFVNNTRIMFRKMKKLICNTNDVGKMKKFSIILMVLGKW